MLASTRWHRLLLSKSAPVERRLRGIEPEVTSTVKDGASLASLAELVYAGRPMRRVWWKELVEDKRDKAAEPNPALLHKKMLQLLSSLWVTRAVGTFARLGLADVMEEGVADHAAIAAARGLVPDRVYRLLRALSTLG